MKSLTIEISFVSTSSLHLFSFMFQTRSLGSLVIPIQAPFTNTLVESLIWSGEILSNHSVPSLSSCSTKSSEGDPTDTNVIRDKFLTRPQAYPSGVSAGQTIPQWVEWSYQGLVSFPDLASGVFNHLKWERVEAKVSLFTT